MLREKIGKMEQKITDTEVLNKQLQLNVRDLQNKLKTHQCNSEHLVNNKEDDTTEFNCEQCNFNSTTQENMNMHKQNHTNIEERRTCKKCNLQCDSRSDLRNHMSLAHNNNYSVVWETIILFCSKRINYLIR